MRPDAPVPADVVLVLLSRADALAAAATGAIESGEDARLSALLDERDAVIDAIRRTWLAPGHRPSAAQVARVTEATRTSLASGMAARNTAIIARDEVLTALAALDARQAASHEYHIGEPHGRIDVVL
jgi:hypothetical protein